MADPQCLSMTASGLRPTEVLSLTTCPFDTAFGWLNRVGRFDNPHVSRMGCSTSPVQSSGHIAARGSVLTV